MFQQGNPSSSTKIPCNLQTVLLQNNQLRKYPSVLINIPSLKVVQLEGNPLEQDDEKCLDEVEKTSEGSDSGLGSQEEEILEDMKNNSRENLKNENFHQNDENKTVRFFTDVKCLIINFIRAV